MALLRLRSSRAWIAALALLLASCFEQGDLTGTEPRPDATAPRVRLPDDARVLYQGDRVRLRVEGLANRAASAELLALAADGTIAWRSGSVTVTDTATWIPVGALPGRVYSQPGLALSAAMEVSGRRVYATDDSVAVLSRDGAARRPVRFLPGVALASEAGSPQSFALDPTAGRLYFATVGRARIGVVDLLGARELPGRDVPTGPVALRFHRGRLGALASGGTELMVLEGPGTAEARQQFLLPTLSVDIRSPRALADSGAAPGVDTLQAAVRPYAGGLAWACGEPACDIPMALTASGLTRANAGADGAVLRRLSLDGSPAAPILVPRFEPGVLSSDTVASRVRIVASAAAGGDSIVFDEGGRMRCPTVALGTGPFDVSSDGAVLYAALADGIACGDGTRLLRIDGPASGEPRVSAVARRNLVGEDRIGSVLEIRVSPDGEAVLVRGDAAVHVFDAELRLRGTLDVTAAAIAWVEGGGSAEQFAIATEDGVTLYDAARLTPLLRITQGGTRESLLLVWRTGQETVVAAAPPGRDGVVISQIPSTPLNR